MAAAPSRLVMFEMSTNLMVYWKYKAVFVTFQLFVIYLFYISVLQGTVDLKNSCLHRLILSPISMILSHSWTENGTPKTVFKGRLYLCSVRKLFNLETHIVSII